MNKKKTILIFIISFIFAFIIVGYVRNTLFVLIDWIDDVTIWQKLNEYYVRTFFSNIIPSFIIAIVSTFLISMSYLMREDSRAKF